jgi:hypothetical protein
MREKILYLLNENVTSPSFLTINQTNDVIQEAMELISEEIKALRQQATLITVPGRFWYTTYEISDTCMSPIRIFSYSNEQRLIPLVMEEVDHHYTNWMSVQSESPQWWYPISFDTFGIWPGPSVGGATLQIDYLAWPETLYDDNDEPILREIEQDLIVLYGQYDGLIRQWDVERAFDIFNKFSTAYRDQRFRKAVMRYNRQIFDREGREGSRGYTE